MSLTEDHRSRAGWERLDEQIRAWWDADVQRAGEDELRDPARNRVWFVDDEHRTRVNTDLTSEKASLLFLPYPYVAGGGNEGAYPEMYCWDTNFINLALFQHGREDLVRNHILNQLFLIERFGMVLTGNRIYYRTRSQTPLLAGSVELYWRREGDRYLLELAYPLLRREFVEYWHAEHHRTPTGLATHRDLGDPNLRAELAAEAESLDFTACYGGDIRRCNPVMLNCALVRYARVLEGMARELGYAAEAEQWSEDAEVRTSRINSLNWDPQEGFYFEYEYDRSVRLPVWSVNAYWALWAGVASAEQAARLVEHLQRFEHPWGLAHTDRQYPSPHPEFSWVQWGYPAGWAPIHMIIVQGLDRYGYHDEAVRVADKYLSLIIAEYHRTGKLWERYNVVEGSSTLPRERTPNIPMHGWTSAAAAWLGRRVFNPPDAALAERL